MAIMMLVEEGKVDLDKPISQYLSDLPTQWTPLTLRQLLSHTSGISEEGSWRKSKYPKDLLKMAKPELDFPTGESWSYSNSGFVLAGLVLEQVSELVASAIAGVYEPTVSLVGFNAQTDPNPAFTQRFLALLQGNDKALPFAPEYQLQRKNNRGKFLSKWMKAFRKIDSLEFLHVEVKNSDRTYYYRTSSKGKPIYAVVTVTAQEQIVSYVAVDQP
jgi:hypothetical protein